MGVLSASRHVEEVSYLHQERLSDGGHSGQHAAVVPQDLLQVQGMCRSAGQGQGARSVAAFLFSSFSFFSLVLTLPPSVRNDQIYCAKCGTGIEGIKGYGITQSVDSHKYHRAGEQ